MFEFGVDELPGLRNRIREMRDRRKLTQPRLGELIGVSHTTIGRLESGEIKLTSQYMTNLAAALDCEPIELIMDIDEAARSPQEAEALRLMRAMEPDVMANWIATARHLVEK